MTRDYNYRRFAPEFYAHGDMAGPAIGDPAPDLSARRLDGEPIRLSSLLGKPLVLETGSLTCPRFAASASAMQQVVQRHPAVRFVVLYVREAHPGSRMGPHRTMDEKLNAAWQLVEESEGSRLVLADRIDGRGHLAYGGYANSVHVIDTDGRIAYRCQWNDPEVLERVLEHLVRNEPIPEHLHQAAESRSALGDAPSVLLHAGLDAAVDFVRAMPSMIGHGRSPAGGPPGNHRR